MKRCYYIGLDVHKKVISYCIKKADGRVVDEGDLKANRRVLKEWVQNIGGEWIGAMEATLFTGWIYDFLKPYARELKVGHSYMLRAICASKKKSDRIDAHKLADMIRCDWFPECHMAPREVRELRGVLRYRNFIVREAVRMKNKTAGLLMEAGVEYNKSRLRGRKYFDALLDDLEDVPESVIGLLRLTRSNMEIFDKNQKRLVSLLRDDSSLKERVGRLMTIPGVGEITALTWCLEIDDPHRFSTIKKAISYCGLCSALDESAGKTVRRPLSKQRNKYMQTILVEAAKLAPRWNPRLRELYDRERERGANRNQATLELARRLVAYMLCVDKSGRNFEMRDAA